MPVSAAFAQDYDGDNTLDVDDKDTDNDGIPDAIELLGAHGIPTFSANLLTLSGFEGIGGLNNGNNFPINISPWVLSNGATGNVVRVDGAGGFDYDNGGPESDAEYASGAGIDQHYLDLVDGGGDFYQEFTVTETTDVEFSGSFSRRNGPDSEDARVRIHQGVGVGGLEVATTETITVSSNTVWVEVSNTVRLSAGTYSIGITMGNNLNFDNARVSVLEPADTDSDTISDRFDYDSDNDGISDIRESGNAAAIAADQNNDGYISNAEANTAGLVDMDSDGAYDTLDVAPIDTDSDGIADYLDLDSDNDGIPDVIENQTTAAYTPAAIGSDFDNDGIVDTFDEASIAYGGNFGLPADTDNDNVPDYLDDDSDNDGIDDVDESGLTLDGADNDDDGIDDAIGASYADPDGNINNLLDNTDGSELLTNVDVDTNEADFRSDAVAPVATADSASVASGVNATIALADNITDGNNNADLSSIDLNTSVAGIQSTNTTTDGSWSVNASGVVTFIPDADYEGITSITYVVHDATGFASNSAALSVTVAGATPVATADSASVNADTIATINLADNISDTNNDVDITTIDLDPSTNGVQNTLTTDDGVWTVDTAGLLTFDPTEGFEGTAVLPYTVSDENGNVSAAAEVSVTVAGAAPVVTADSANVAANTVATIDLTDNVSDPNDDADISTIDLDPSTAGIRDELTTDDGVWNVNAAGQLSFVPDSTFEGTSTISYAVEDDSGNVSNTTTVSVTVTGAAPVADADNALTDQNTPVTIDVLDGDTDANGDLDPSTLDLDPATAGIQTSLSLAGVGELTVVGNQVEFDPSVTFTGHTFFTYTVSDAAGNVSNIANVSVSVGVLPDNDADGIPDNVDLDDDNDGLTDSTEAGGSDTDGDGVIDGFVDTDLDGLHDVVAIEPLPTGDSDNDGLEDYLDVDSDNDGLTDAFEAGGTDEDRDGIIDGFTDANGDGQDDATLTAPLPRDDFDEDGIPDFRDLDSDNDGLTDANEAAETTKTVMVSSITLSIATTTDMTTA